MREKKQLSKENMCYNIIHPNIFLMLGCLVFINIHNCSLSNLRLYREAIFTLRINYTKVDCTNWLTSEGNLSL